MKSTKLKVYEFKFAKTGIVQSVLVIIVTILGVIALVLTYIPHTQPPNALNVLVAIALLLLARIVQAWR